MQYFKSDYDAINGACSPTIERDSQKLHGKLQAIDK